MSSTLIQQSLIDIEQNLKKLESARSQVGTMADKSEQLITSVASVIKSIEAIKNSFSTDENYFKNSVHESLEEFSQSLSNGAESANKKTIDISEKYKVEIQESTKFFMDELKCCTENANANAVEINTTLKKVIEGIINKINEFQANLSDVQKSILDFDLEKSLDKIRAETAKTSELIMSNQTTTNREISDLKSRIESSNNLNEKSAKLNLTLLAAGFVLTILVVVLTR